MDRGREREYFHDRSVGAKDEVIKAAEETSKGIQRIIMRLEPKVDI